MRPTGPGRRDALCLPRPHEIHQFVHVLARGDAIGEHTFQMRELLREMGFVSEVWAAHDSTDGEAAGTFRSFRPARRRRTWLLYHASTGSPVADWLHTRPEPLVVAYHNITPPHFFAPWNPGVAKELETGRRQLAGLARRSRLAMAPSQFNAAELSDLGYRDTSVLHLIVDLSDRPEAEGLTELLTTKTGTMWLHVGRIAPNKAQHDLVKALAVYRSTYDAGAQLHLVGFPASLPYRDAVVALAEELGVSDAVHLPGPVPAPALEAYYRAADVYVGASEHEGFYLPLLEAMARDLPVVAHRAGAAPETAGGAALLVDKTPARLAAAANRVVNDADLRDALIARGRARVADFDVERTKARIREAIERAVDSST